MYERRARLAAVGRAMVARLDAEEVLEQLLATVQQETEAAYAAIGVLDPDGDGLARFITRGIDAEERDRIGPLPRGRGVLGVLIDQPEPLRLDEVGAHPRSYGFPAGHPVMRTFLGVPIMVADQAWGNLYLTEKAGGVPFTEEDEEAVVALATWAGIALENSRLFMDAAARGEQLEVVVRRLEATTAVARAVGTETDLRRVLELIVKRARALVQARAVVLLLTEGDDLLVAAGAGQVDSRALGVRIQRAGSALGESLETGHAEAVQDAAAKLALGDDRLGVVGAETAILVPLHYRGTGLGVLAAFDHLGDDAAFAPAEVDLLEAFAASAATAVATAQTVERDRLRHSVDAAERERTRWARQLHDDTLQGLGAIRLMLTNGLRSDDHRALRSAAREAAELVGAEVTALRRLISELRPAALDQLGLGPAIRTLGMHEAEVHGLEVRSTIDDDGAGHLPDTLQTAIYRIVQEALGNAVRHARPRRVDIVLRSTPDEVRVSVTDDGNGFDPDAPRAGFGLAGMRERAGLAGGTLEIASSADGTKVTAAFPLDGDGGQRSTSPLSSA